MRLDSDDFELFGLPRQFKQDRAQIDAQWRRLQAQVHPDRFTSEGAAAQRLSMQWSVRVNEAFGRLKNPLSRAAYLCELGGASVAAHDNTAMPANFLMEQISWREALEDSKTSDDLQSLQAEITAARGKRMESLERLLDAENDVHGAALEVRALMFIERLSNDLEQRLDELQT